MAQIDSFFFFTSILLLGRTATCDFECAAAQTSGDPSCGNGAYINICGECVGGSTGRDATHGLDRCGVCFGDDLCVGCDGQPNSGRSTDACGKCLPQKDPQRNNCVRISRMDPDVLDLAVDKISTISLKGAHLNRTNIPDLKCDLIPVNMSSQQSELTHIEMITVEDDVIQLEIVVAQQQGSYNLQCNSSAVSNLTSPNLMLTIVNSKDLSVTSIIPSAARIEQSFQPIITVSKVVGHSNVLCFVRPSGSDNAQVLLPVAVEGTKIICSNYTAHQAHHLEIGAIFTEDAALEKDSQGPVAVTTIEATLPSMKDAVLTNDLQYIHIQFDQNMEGSKECADLLNPHTMTLLGEDPKCSFIANRLIIQLGNKPALQTNTPLQLAEGCKIYRANSDTKLCAQAKGVINLKTSSEQTAKPIYRVLAPNIICSGQASMSQNNTLTNFQPSYVRLVSSNGQKLRYKWYVNVPNLSQIPNKGQVENLKLWRNIRGLAKEMKTLTDQQTGNQYQLNSSMFRADMTYEFNVVGVNILGMRGDEKKFTVQIDESNNLVDVILLGPLVTPADAEYYAEAKVFTCNESVLMQDLLYEWNVSSNVEIDIGLQQGMKLRLPSGVLSPGRKYIIKCTVKLSDGSNITLGQGNMTIEANGRDIKAIIATSELTVGTDQDLYLDGSASEDTSRQGNIKIQWCCFTIRGSTCTLPEPGSKTVQSKYSSEFQKSTLHLPAKSLPMGEYNFTLSIYQNESDVSSTWTRVLVIPGLPPMVNITSDIRYHFVDPSEGVTIQASITNIYVGCHIWWEVVQESGFEYFDLRGTVGLGDIIKITEEEETSNQPSEVPVYIPGPIGNWSGLVGDTKYKFRLTATCPVKGKKFKQYEGHADVIIETNTPPIIKPLQVVPNQGEALRTQFEFSTDEAYDSASDMPLQYNFGYRLTDEGTNIFSSTNEDLKAYTLLPAEGGGETFITPILEVCDSHKLCTLSEGEKVRTVPPNELSSAEVDKILKRLSSFLTTGQYTKSLSLIRTSLQTLKKMDDDTLYKRALEEIEKLLVQELKVQKDRLRDNPNTIQDSLDFSNMALLALRELPMSDHILQELSDFKDEILKVISNSIYNQKYRLKRSTPDSTGNTQKRNRRQLPTFSETNFPATKKTVRDFLYLNEQMIMRANISLVEKGITSLLADLLTWVVVLCKISQFGNPNSLDSRIVSFKIEKQMDKKLCEKQVDLLTQVNPPITAPETFVNISKELLNTCVNPVCVGNTLFPKDFLKEFKEGVTSTFNLTRNDSVHGVWILHTNKWNLTAYDIPTTIQLPLAIDVEASKNQEYRCAAWRDGWKSELCETIQVLEQANPKIIKCKCVVSTYIRVIMETVSTTTETTTTTPTTTIEPTTTPAPTTLAATTTTIPVPTSTITTTILPITTTTQQTVTQKMRIEERHVSNTRMRFRIEENYANTVGQNKEEFLEIIKKHLLEQIDMPVHMIQDLDIIPGSIIVTMTLVDSDGKRVEEIIPIIVQIIESGKLNMYGRNNEKLNVPAQKVEILPPHSEEHTRIVTYAVGGVVGVSTSAVAFFFIAAVIYRSRKEKLRMLQLQASAQNKVPTYRKFQFEGTIDGTEESLAQYRSNYPMTGTVSTMMGLKMLTGLGTQLNIPSRNLSYEVNNKSLHGYDSKKLEKKRKKNEKKTDTDSGIMDYEKLQYHQSTAKQNEKNKKSSGSMVSLDNLPGTPTDD